MPKSPPSQDPTPMFARQVIELYADALSEVRFPDLDLDTLRSARDELQSAQLQLDAIESEMQRSRSAVEAQAVALDALADRALAYARVYAGQDGALATRIADMGRKRAAPASSGAAPKRRGRAPKSPHADDLFGAAPERGDSAATGLEEAH